jgi:hypothetical protein
MSVNIHREKDSDGPLHDSASSGTLAVARWLIDHGADLDQRSNNGVTPLISAIIAGKTDLAKLLIDKGADTTVTFGDEQESLSQLAVRFGRQEILDLLSPGSAAPSVRGSTDRVIQHVDSRWGRSEEIAGQRPDRISLRAIAAPDRTVLFTAGLGNVPLLAPVDHRDFSRVELVMYLPRRWQVPRGRQATVDVGQGWPFAWIRRIADHAATTKEWLGIGESTFVNDDPPQPLGDLVPFSGFLMLNEDSETGSLSLGGSRCIKLMTLVPLFAKEVLLVKQRGLRPLLDQFQQHGVSEIIDLERRCVV